MSLVESLFKWAFATTVRRPAISLQKVTRVCLSSLAMGVIAAISILVCRKVLAVMSRMTLLRGGAVEYLKSTIRMLIPTRTTFG